jgi:hypothetical protein
MSKGVTTSAREAVQAQIVSWLKQDPNKWTAPYGVLEGLAKDKSYRSVTFGVARTLDAEVRIYGPEFMILRTSRGHNEKVTSVKDLFSIMGGL